MKYHEEETEDEFRIRQASEIRVDRDKARRRLIDRLDEEGETKHAARLERCGEFIGMTCTSCGTSKAAYRRCDQKHCPACAPLLAHKKVTRLDPVCREFLHPLFVTFTTKNFRAAEKKGTGIRQLRQAFTKLRRQRWWRDCVLGGVCTFELTNKGKGWHPHGHALIDCAWLSVSVTRPPPGTPTERFKARARAAATEVAEQFALVMQRPCSVKVRSKGLREAASNALREVVKYSLKPGALEQTKGLIGPVLDEMARTRQLVTWGSAYRHPSLREQPKRQNRCDCCQAVGSYLPDAVIKVLCRRTH